MRRSDVDDVKFSTGVASQRDCSPRCEHRIFGGVGCQQYLPRKIAQLTLLLWPAVAGTRAPLWDQGSW
jgi:hypothetical protein